MFRHVLFKLVDIAATLLSVICTDDMYICEAMQKPGDFVLIIMEKLRLQQSIKRLSNHD